MMIIRVKTKWLLPVLIIGLAILVLMEPPISASEQSLADTDSATGAAAAKAEASVAPEAKLDNTAFGTY